MKEQARVSSIAAQELADAVEAVRVRCRYAPSRWAIGAASAGFSIPALGWAPSAIWFGAWAATQLLEYAVLTPVVRRGEMSRLRFGLVASVLAATALTFSSLSIVYWLTESARGGVVASLIVLGALLNALLMCQSSRRLFLALAAPALFFLTLQPVLMLLAPGGLELVPAVAAGVFCVLGTCMILWRQVENTHGAERSARVDLQAEVARAEEAVAAKSQFVAMVGHELRTPISGVLAAAAELERHTDPAVREHGALIAEGGAMMRTVLNDLLDLAKIEAGRMSVEHTTFDMRELVGNTAKFWATEAAGKRLDLGVRGLERLPAAVEGDPLRVRQILNNLLSNAVKFTDKGAISILAQVGDDASGRAVMRIAVSDSGPGLSPERIARLFTPFSQADASVARLHGGTGLGLAISRNLARLMDGELDVDSRPGAGSTFTLKLPLRAARSAPVKATAASMDELATGLRVLIADDHAINRRALRLLLTPLQPQVTEARNGGEALAALAAAPFDVVLMDVNMPDMSGLDVTRRLRAEAGPNRDAPVLAVTAATDAADVRGCLMAGMNGFVAKPIDAADLLQAVSAATAPVEVAAEDAPRAAA